MKLMIFLHFFLIEQILSQLLQVMKFKPKLGSGIYDVDVVKVATDANKTLDNGYSFCIRANFQIINTNCLFKADSNLDVTLFEFQRGGGSIKFSGVETYFQYEPDVLERLSTWQSYCVVYNPKLAIQVWFPSMKCKSCLRLTNHWLA
jgi:hypothetical protein